MGEEIRRFIQGYSFLLQHLCLLLCLALPSHASSHLEKTRVCPGTSFFLFFESCCPCFFSVKASYNRGGFVLPFFVVFFGQADSICFLVVYLHFWGDSKGRKFLGDLWSKGLLRLSSILSLRKGFLMWTVAFHSWILNDYTCLISVGFLSFEVRDLR